MILIKKFKSNVYFQVNAMCSSFLNFNSLHDETTILMLVGLVHGDFWVFFFFFYKDHDFGEMKAYSMSSKLSY